MLARHLRHGSPRRLWLVLAVTLCLTGACGGKSDASPTPPPTKQTAEPDSALAAVSVNEDAARRACDPHENSTLADALGPLYNDSWQMSAGIPPENYVGCGFQIQLTDGGLGIVEYDLATFPLAYHLDNGTPLETADYPALKKALEGGGYRSADDYARTAGAAYAFTHTTTEGLDIVLVGGANVWFISTAITMSPEDLASVATALETALTHAS